MRYANKAASESEDERMRFFTVWTALSAIPFACGYSGLLVTWRMLLLATKSANSFEANCGPLSVISSSGIPCRAKIFLIC